MQKDTLTISIDKTDAGLHGTIKAVSGDPGVVVAFAEVTVQDIAGVLKLVGELGALIKPK